ncbi:MAG: DUF6385 domain-containing protein [candidate division KSB1 bacterium]|nr:DUF6385 domain-containing protein [candidate division KSB1 bacterium]
MARDSGIQAIIDAITASAGEGEGGSSEYIEAQLTAAGQSTPWRPMSRGQAIVAYTVALNGSTSVAIRIEWSNDGTTNRGNVDDANTVITSNGSDFFVVVAKLPYIRLSFVSETGGSNATIDVLVIA